MEGTMKRSTLAAIVVFIAVTSGPAQADTVTDWNQTAIEVMKVARVAGNPWSRALAMMHVAMSDAINSVQGRYTRYVTTVPVVPGASAEAAAASAARQVLTQLFPLFDPNVKRPFNNIAEMDEEHKNVRIWGGIHFRNSLDVGYGMGEKIAAYLIANSLRPAR
jgi:hypothetical protein